MSTSVTIGSIAAAMSGVAGHAHRHWGDEVRERWALLLKMLFRLAQPCCPRPNHDSMSWHFISRTILLAALAFPREPVVGCDS